VQAAALPALQMAEEDAASPCLEMMLLQDPPPEPSGLQLTVSASSTSSTSDEDQPQSKGKRKRNAAEPAKQGKARGLRRSVSFSKSSMIRMTEIVAEPSSPVPVELKTDHEAAMRVEDGPRPAATLLDDLIVAFFERGSINSSEDIRTHLETTFPGRSGELPAVASRLESVIAKLDADGGFVGLLPSNVRLGLEHKPHLSQLLSWLSDAVSTVMQNQTAALGACGSSSSTSVVC